MTQTDGLFASASSHLTQPLEAKTLLLREQWVFLVFVLVGWLVCLFCITKLGYENRVIFNKCIRLDSETSKALRKKQILQGLSWCAYSNSEVHGWYLEL